MAFSPIFAVLARAAEERRLWDVCRLAEWGRVDGVFEGEDGEDVDERTEDLFWGEDREGYCAEVAIDVVCADVGEGVGVGGVSSAEEERVSDGFEVEEEGRFVLEEGNEIGVGDGCV